MEAATLGAAHVPLEVAAQGGGGAGAGAAGGRSCGNLNAISDAGTGAALARAALTGAGYNVRINVASLQDAAQEATCWLS